MHLDEDLLFNNYDNKIYLIKSKTLMYICRRPIYAKLNIGFKGFHYSNNCFIFSFDI